MSCPSATRSRARPACQDRPVDSEAAVSELAGSFVVEVGQRQAWTFIGFADIRPTPSRETRLYIDAIWHTSPAGAPSRHHMLRLMDLDGSTIETASTVGDPASLVITFEGGPQLTIPGEPAYASSGGAWWFTPWR